MNSVNNIVCAIVCSFMVFSIDLGIENKEDDQDGVVVAIIEGNATVALANPFLDESDDLLDGSFESNNTSKISFVGINFGIVPGTIGNLGRFIIPGHQSFSNNFAVARLLPTGEFDGSFGFGTGRVVGTTGDIAIVFGVTLDAVGKILVFAGKLTGELVVIQLNTNGTLDLSFAPFGRKTIVFGGSGFEATSFSIDNQGRIFVSGFLTLPGILSFAV